VARPYGLPCAMGLLLRESGRRRARLSGLLQQGPGPSVRLARLPNRGVRERLYARAGCHAAPEGKESFCCGYSEDRCRRNWHSTSVLVQPARLRLGSRDCDGSQASLNSDCQKTGESNFSSSTTRHVACNVVVNAFQQYEGLVYLATAKLERRCTILGLAHPPLRETARIHWRFTMSAC
jgi:hypothetical protein